MHPLTLVLQLLTIALVVAGGSALVLWRFPKAWKSMKLAAVATVWGLGLLLATYFWAFDGSHCSDALSVTCRVNENQGVLTLLTILLAVLALWATLLTRELEEREKKRIEQSDLEAAVAEAFHEATHNLIHVAQAFDQDKSLRRLPQTSRLAVARLLQPGMATKLPRRYKLSVDAVYRTWELLQALSWSDSYAQKVPAALKNYTRACLLLLRDSEPGRV